MLSAGDTIVLRSANDVSRQSFLAQIPQDTKIHKVRVSLKDIVGTLAGGYYELRGRRLQSIATPLEAQSNENEAEQRAEDGFEERRGDNSGYVDSNTAQKLTDADIARLRAEGLSGDDIIQQLIQNSDTFGLKTDFAQEKWIKRKEAKYKKKFQVLSASAMNICEASRNKNKDKICNLRYDVFALMMGQSGVHAGCRALVVESMVGMVTGACLQRMDGKGRLLAVYGTQQPHLEMVRCYNAPTEHISIVEPVPATELGPAAKAVCLEGFANFQHIPVIDDRPVRQKTVSEAKEGEPSNHAIRKRRKVENKVADQLSATGRTAEGQQRVRSYLRQGVDHLIIACKYRPLPILKTALCLLTPSSPFVVYHEFLEPLIDCYLYLQDHSLALRLVLSDLWLREYQVLAGRTRPDMFMSTSGGYLLSGIYVGTVPRPFLLDEAASTAESNLPTEDAAELVSGEDMNS